MKSVKALTLAIPTLLVCILIVQAPNADSTISGCDFVVFSDSHVGRGEGSDGFTGAERMKSLIQSANGAGGSFFVNTGDLVDGGVGIANQYELYNNISQSAAKPILNVKGNHDDNNIVFEYMEGNLNWIRRYGDVLVVGIGCVAENGQWDKGLSYDNTTIAFLNWVLSSGTYQQTQYHFLFQHFEPNSTWYGYNVFPDLFPFYKAFNMILCGHEGGSEFAFKFNGTPVVHAAHLVDGRATTDTYLTVTINRGYNITVSSNNFLLKTKYTLCTISAISSPAIKGSIQFQDYDMDTSGEFVLKVNGRQVYSCPSNSRNHGIWVSMQLDVSAYLHYGFNTLTIANPTTAYNMMRNLVLKANDLTVVSDPTNRQLQNCSYTYSFSI